MRFYIYDLETFVNCFTFAGKFHGGSGRQVFEMSFRKNERDGLMQWLSYLQNFSDLYMVGFNNLGFDYPIIHELLNNQFTFSERTAYNLAQQIIGSQKFGAGFGPHSVRPKDRIIPQIDLYRVNHFDNPNKSTTLKDLQFAMRAPSVEDLPYSPHEDLTSEQIDQLIAYNLHDVDETERFLDKCLHLIKMRQELLESGVISGDVLNYSDVKIGTEYLINKIGRQKCFNGSKPKQTFRTEVPLKSVILNKVQFQKQEAIDAKEWFELQTVQVGSKERPQFSTRLGGLQFHFGLGGVHGSVNNRKYETNETHIIKDVDVSGMYPAVALANGFYPEHLGQAFSVAYKQLKSDRDKYPKGTTMNKVLKLASNGAFGNSNNSYSCFYDPRLTYSITANGQLQLLQLAESLSMIPGLELIQANTDGITAYVRRDTLPFFDFSCRDWERMTGLALEEVTYSRMWIADVNNYLAEYPNGKLKLKGKYWYPESDEDYEGVWNKDFSAIAIQKAAVQVMVNGCKISDVTRTLTDKFDFMLRYKTKGNARVYIGEKQMNKTVRYYVSTAGQRMRKVAPPAKGEIGAYKRKNAISDAVYEQVAAQLQPGQWDERIHTKNKSKYEIVTTSIESGWLVKECNRAEDFNWDDVDFKYYEEQIEKLIITGRQES